jgi:F-type H+-transporting ATPase subunit a
MEETPTFMEWLGLVEPTQDLMHHMGWPFNDEGETWGMLGANYDIAHNPGHGAIAFLHVLFVLILLTGIALLTYSKVKDTDAALIPEEKLTIRTFCEVMVGAIYGMMKSMMGDKAARFFLPLIGTCGFFILFSNALGLVPFMAPPTSSMDVTLACGLIIFFATHIFGIREQGFVNYVKHFAGPILWLAPLMILIEVISHLVRPLSLAIRLMANMFADHAVLAAFFTLASIAGLSGFLLPVPVLVLGSLVVVVQALVFCLLSTVYISMAIEHSEGH